MRVVRGRHGTRSTTRMPELSSCCTLSGLLESNRTRRTPSKRKCRGGKPIVSRIGGEAKFLVGLDRVHAAVLQFVGAQLVHEADAAPLLRQIQQDAGRRRGNAAQRKFELRAAIAAFGGQNIAGEALRMDAHERRLAANSPVHQSDGAFLFVFSLDAENFKWAETRRQLGAGDDSDAVIRPVARSASAVVLMFCVA